MSQSPEEMMRVVSDWKNFAPKWFLPTQANFAKLSEYIFTEAGGGIVSTTSLSKAAEVLKDTLEHKPPTPEEDAQARRQAAIQTIFAAVQQTLTPASLDLANSDNYTRVFEWVRANGGNVINQATVLAAVKALATELIWTKEPAGLAKLRRNSQFGFEDSRDESPRGRFNHALEDPEAKAKAARKKVLSTDVETQMKEEEAAAIERHVMGYEATTFSRTDRGLTETIRGLLRAYVEKFGCDSSDIRDVIRAMPDEPSYAATWLRNKIGTGTGVTQEHRTIADLAPRLR